SLCYKPIQPYLEEVSTRRWIDEIYTTVRYFGLHRIAEMLKIEGVNIYRKKVQRRMREMGIQAVYPGANLSKRNLEHRVCPYLLKSMNITRPNQVWSIDITYIRLHHSWMYLTVIIDWYSCYVFICEFVQSLAEYFFFC